MRFAIGFLLVFSAGHALAQSPLVLADYNAEVRGTDGRVDVPVLVRRLSELRVNTYFFLIWHRATDWDDLKRFLPAARNAGIDTWVYLVPPSESPPIYGTRYSEPFRLDYPRWAEEIARLSLDHANLKAFVIDDFWANRHVFTPAYVSNMRRRARAIAPDLEFWPLMYYRELDREFIDSYGGAIDGVVAAYPKTEQSVQRAWLLLNDRLDAPERWQFIHPAYTRSAVGDHALIQRGFRVLPTAARYALRLVQRDSYEGPTAGYHFKQVLIDGRVVWEEDVAGGERIWQTVELSLAPWVGEKSHLTLTIRVYDRERVSNFPVTVEVREPIVEGLVAEGEWQREIRGHWSANFASAYRGAGEYRIPLVVMIAANRPQFVKRNGEPATPERVRDKVKMALVQRRQGFCEGVVTYALPKVPDDAIFKSVRQLFLKASTSRSADFDGDGIVGFGDFLLFANAFGKVVGEYATVFARFDLDLDGRVGMGDFLFFARTYGETGDGRGERREAKGERRKTGEGRRER